MDIEALATPYIFKVKTLHFKFNLLGSGVSQRCYAVVLIKKKKKRGGLMQPCPCGNIYLVAGGELFEVELKVSIGSVINSLFVRPAP